MLPVSPRFLFLGLLLFLAGTACLVFAFDTMNRWLLGAGSGLVLLAVGSFSMGAWCSRHRSGPLDQRRERKLWRSGPLGRKWLEGRRRIP